MKEKVIRFARLLLKLDEIVDENILRNDNYLSLKYDKISKAITQSNALYIYTFVQHFIPVWYQTAYVVSTLYH